MDTNKNEMVRYSMVSVPMKWYSILRVFFFHYFLINFVVDNDVRYHGQSLLTNNCTRVSIFKSTFKE